MKISVCLITLNEAEALPRCLESCAALADELVILDSGSTDATAVIARQFRARWFHQDWLGYVGQKNRLLTLAAHPWVLNLDADEALSPALQHEIATLKAHEPPPDLAGFSVPRCVFYAGQWIRHGDWYPDRLVRLFRRDQARFTGGKVHERLEISGPVAPLAGDLEHYSFRDDADLRTRSQQYARLWAETQAEAGRTAGPWDPWLHAAGRWFHGYLLKRGFLDGTAGWQIARHCASEVWLKYRLLRQGVPPGKKSSSPGLHSEE